MIKKFFPKDVCILIVLFIISRVILDFFGVRLDFTALFSNWQYLDVHTLRTNLFNGIWFDHTQPPVFNLFLGFVVKLSGNYTELVFTVIFKLITLINTLLISAILKRALDNKYLPLVFSMIYLLSPATMVFENELFYTTFISLLLLTSCYYLQDLQKKVTWENASSFFFPLMIICLTRSLYHLVWLVFISVLVLIYYRKKNTFRIVLSVSVITLLLTGSWYLKNYILFKEFSTSTWIGMNIARNVFHDTEIKDSSRIESIVPFSKISVYKDFLPANYETPYRGINDYDLLHEMKNDTFINAKNVGYIEVSKKYMAASIKQIKKQPFEYFKNVLQSAVIFFAPATLYPTTEFQARKIKYYDIAFSFNLSHFAKGKQERRIALTISALPKILLYLLVIFSILKNMIRNQNPLLLHLFILGTIGYIFCISSLFEHYENMRFRYEAEPLFLILTAYVTAGFFNKKKQNK
jgi:hypothetical protein